MEKFIKVGDEKLYVNFLDVDFRKKYTHNLERFHDEISKVDVDSMEESESMLIMARKAEAFFDSTWGEGTFDRIFNGVRDLDAIYDVLMRATDMKDEQEIAFATKTAEYTKKVLGEDDDESING